MTVFGSFIRGVVSWIGPGSKQFDLIRIYALGALIGFFFLFFGDISVENGAADYVQLALAIVGDASLKGQVLNGGQGRDIGMALIWLISGYLYTHSFIGVIAIQVLMGLTMPLLCYLALRPWFPRAAYWTTLAGTLSLAPILLSKLIHHDQPYIFFTIVSLYVFNRFMLTTRPRSLYILSISVFAVDLMRQAGTGLFWILLPICAFHGGRRNYKHITFATAIFIGANFAYTQYISNLMGNTESEIGGVTGPGIQLFYNIYTNSSEFGVSLSPRLGPSVSLILNRLHQCSLPSPAQSKLLANWPGPAQFSNENIYRYTADELVNKVATQSNREYYYLIMQCVAAHPSELDRILLNASLEIARVHPLYILELFLRNSLELLYDPGWLHGRFTTAPQFQGGLIFPFGDNVRVEQGGNIGDTRFAQRALSEASFIPLERQPQFVADLYFSIHQIWYRYYHPITIVLGCLAWFSWFSTALGLLQQWTGAAWLTRCSSRWLSDRVIPASIGISALLLWNVAIVAIAVEPLYRYDFGLLTLKIMLAGVGVVVFLNLAQRAIWLLRMRLKMLVHHSGEPIKG